MADLTPNQLPAISWLVDLKDDDRDLLSSYGEFIPGLKDQVLIKEGSTQRFLYFVISGKLQVQSTMGKDRKKVFLGNIGAGESIGEMSLFDNNGSASATVTPIEFCQLWRIGRENLSAFMKDNPGAAVKILSALLVTVSRRLRDIHPHLVILVDPSKTQVIPALQRT